MTVIPTKPTPFAARGDADFVQEFVRYQDQAMTQPLDLTGWTFRFAVKASPLDASALLEATSAGGGVTIIEAAGGRLRVFIERDLLAAAVPAGATRLEGVCALQATGPSDADEVWAAGPFILMRGV